MKATRPPSRISTWIQRAVNLGAEPGLNAFEARRLRIVNLVGLSLFLVTLANSLIGILGLRLQLVLCGLALAPGFLLPLALNRARKRSLARGWLIIYQTAILYLFTWVMGRAAHMHLGALATLGVALLIFERHPIKLPLKIAAIAAIYPFGVFFAKDGVLLSPLEPSALVWFRTSVDLSIGLVVCLQVFYLRHTAEEFEEELGDALERNTQLLKIVCHDVANPLSVILYDSDRDLPSPRSEGERLDRIFRNTRRLVQMLGTVRELQKKQDTSGRAPDPIHTSTVRVSDAIRDALEIYRAKLDSKNISIHVEGGTLDVLVHANRDVLVSSVFGNALSNAHKFTPDGGMLRIFIERGARAVVIRFHNSGPGIDPARLQELQTQLRTAVSTDGTAGEKGSGFGFYQMRTQIERMSGTMEVQSTLGQGTTVCFSLRSAENKGQTGSGTPPAGKAA